MQATETQVQEQAAGPRPRGAWISAQRYLEMIRFSHTVFALPFALLGVAWAVAAPGSVTSELTAAGLALRCVGVVLCMVTARSAAMAFNRLIDASIDARNPRTAGRHIPSGQLTARGVKTFFVVMAVGFVLACGLFWPNWLPLAGSLPVLAWICGYSYAKRFTAAAHLWLGCALALSPVCAWVAVRGEEVIVSPADILPAVMLGAAIAVWVAGFDIIYACQDADFDRRSGLHSLPAYLGVRGALRLAAGLHLIMLVLLALLPGLFPQLALGWVYYGALACVAGLVIAQHALVSPGDLARVNIAFFHINAVLSLGFSAAAAIDALWM
jgi:4-hydroxybenzoate polyprenyltransferase